MQYLDKTDKELIAQVESGASFETLNDTSKNYRKLLTSIMFQYADSQLAAAETFSQSISIAPSLPDRIDIASICQEKMVMAQETYELIKDLGINLEKYFSSHDWGSRVSRFSELGYSRVSADKRLNALMYPVEGWCDTAIFTYLMSLMTVIQLEDFAKSSYEPWARLTSKHISRESKHGKLGLKFVDEYWDREEEPLAMQVSLNYWFKRVSQSFGPKVSDGNYLHRSFKIKYRQNDESRYLWREKLVSIFEPLGLLVPELDFDDEATCN